MAAWEGRGTGVRKPSLHLHMFDQHIRTQVFRSFKHFGVRVAGKFLKTLDLFWERYLQIDFKLKNAAPLMLENSAKPSFWNVAGIL